MELPERSESPGGRVLVISDNRQLVERFRALLESELSDLQPRFDFACSPFSDFLTKLDVRSEWESLVGRYDLVISLHCKQLFPAAMVMAIRCVNVHPGLNPWNRGWYPQVFGIINKLPMGATIHEIDEELDHGAIIDQVEIPVEAHETSLDVYERALDAELLMLRRSLRNIVDGSYVARAPAEEGNLNLRRDFEALRKIDREELGTFGDFIDRLRALTHGDFRNAYFIDDVGRRVYIRCVLDLDENDQHAASR
jgi:dTDP-4-amino-4,6-dideoxyglucose formyltransferase